MKFVQIIFKGETSRARLLDNQYTEDDVMHICLPGKPIMTKLEPCVFWEYSLEEMQNDLDYTVEEITEEEYWKDKKTLLLKHYDDEIEQMKAQLNKKIKARDELSLSLVL